MYDLRILTMSDDLGEDRWETSMSSAWTQERRQRHCHLQTPGLASVLLSHLETLHLVSRGFRQPHEGETSVLTCGLAMLYKIIQLNLVFPTARPLKLILRMVKPASLRSPWSKGPIAGQRPEKKRSRDITSCLASLSLCAYHTWCIDTKLSSRSWSS